MFFNGMGAIARQVKKYSNLVTGGNFALDTDLNGIANGWYAGTSAGSGYIQNNTQYWTPATAENWSSCIQTAVNIPNVKGRKYYFCGNLSNISYVLTDQTFMQGAEVVDGFNSKIFTSTVDAALVRLSLYARTANTQCSANRPVLYDITDLPAEQQTLEWCNANIAPNITW